MPDTPLPPAVHDALGRVAVLVRRDDGALTVGGRRIPAGDPTTDPVDAVTAALYDSWYTRTPGPSSSLALPPPVHRGSLAAVLRAAHAGAELTETGWVVASVDPRGTVTAMRNGHARRIRAGEYLLRTRPGVPPAPGEPVEPLARRDHLDVERGLWWTYTEIPPHPPIGRVYLDPRPATMPSLLHETTRALLSIGLPFQLKCPELAIAASRVDALIVYHARTDRQRLLAALLERWSSLGPLLEPHHPPLTCGLRPGLSWADDPGGDQSFGESRCKALARAVLTAEETWPAADLDARLAVLVDGLRAAGIDPSHPWKAP
jgi:hypothetical protein